MADLLGTEAAKELQENIKKELETFEGRTPCLGIVRVGERPDDLAYEKSAVKRMEGLGMNVRKFTFPADVTDAEFKESFRHINNDPEINGILMFSPLPKSIDEKGVLAMMNPEKDIDGLTHVNQALVYCGEPEGIAPCTAEAVIKLLDFAGIELRGKRVTVVGRGKVIGRPVSVLLTGRDATVTLCHSKTENLREECKKAEILVVAIGQARMIDASYVSEGTVVIDVGINVDEDGNLCGDVDHESVSEVASLITPVPRGVGSVTTTVLAEHLLRAAKGGSRA